MAKKLVAKVGTYTNSNGEQKNQWVNIGVILSGENGEYALIDPTVNLAGVLMKQRVMMQKAGKKVSGDSVMCSIFDNDGQPNQQPQNSSYGQGVPPNTQGQANYQGSDDFGGDIPFIQHERGTVA